MKKSELRKLIRESIKDIMEEKQPLNEMIYCTNPPAGSSCGGGKIWCEVADDDNGFGAGCFCRYGSWCNQFGSNEVCDRYADGTCIDPSVDKFKTNKKTLEPTLEPTRDQSRLGMREEMKAECYVCMFQSTAEVSGGRYSCEKQQVDSQGGCDGGYSSSSRCERKCHGRKGDRGMRNTNSTKFM